tara:strand:+ start:1563 stop:1832 length:270 start_codon:yes stop_codon:yes gene_type:complete
MSWKQVTVNGKDDLLAYQRRDEVTCANVLGKKISSIDVDGKEFVVVSTEIDARDDQITIKLKLPIGRKKGKGEPDGESNESTGTDKSGG